MTYYTSTTNVIYLGNYAQTDTHEYNYHDENAAAVLTGQTFNAGDMEIVSATFNSGYDHYVNDDDYGSGETFSYDVGAGHTTQTLDSTTVACVTVTAPDGSTSDIYVTLFQAQNGDLFMSDYNNCGYLDNLQISSIEITSFYSTNYSAYYAPSNVENTTIVPLDTSDGTVDGENTGEVMGLGYDDANAPNDQGGDVITNDDDVIFGNGGDDSIDGAGGNDTIYGDNVVGSNGYAQGELLVNGALEAGVATGGQHYSTDVEGWTSGAGAFEVWGSGFEHETSQDGGNFVELDRGGEVDQISQDVTTVDGSTYTLTVDAKQRIEGSDDQVEVYFGGTLVGVIQPGDEWQTFEFEVTGSGSDTLTLREPSSDNNSYGPLIDNVSLVGDIPGTDTGADGADTIVGNDGDDTIYGGGENDTIYGDDVDGTVTTVRESFNWEGATDAEIDGGFSQNTGSVTVTYDRTADAGHHESALNGEVLNVDGIDGGTEAIDTVGGLQSVNNGTDGRGTFEWTFSEEVENVEFNVNDIDGDGVVTITAFDADGNPIEVQLDGGANLTLVDTDSVAGVDTADSNGGYENNDSPNYNLQVTIPGPVSRIVVDHTQDGVNNSGVTVTDIFFDVPTSVTGDDTIEGNDGDDLIYGGGGNDVIYGDNATSEVSGNTDEDFAPTVTDNIDDSYGTETRSTYAVELVTLANGDLVMITSERDTSDDGIATYKIDNDPASATYGQVIGTDPNNSGDNDLGAKIDSIGDNSGGNIAGYGKIADLAAVTLDNGKTYVYTADDEGGAAGGAIGIAEIDADGNLTQLGHISDTETHDMKELTIAEVDGETFLIGLNSTSSTDALTVYKINDDGSLTQTDTIYDVDGTGENYLDGDDPFGSATLLESFTNSDGNTFVIAGGADDGVSLWTLDSTGQLTMRDARGDDEFKAGDLIGGTQTGLNDPAAATFAEVDGTTYVFVGGNDDDIVVFEVIGDPSDFDLRLVGQLDNAVNDISSMAFLPDGSGSGKLVVGGEQQGLEFYDITVNGDGTVSVALNTVAPDDGEPGAELLDSEDIDVEGGILVSASDNDNGVAVLTSGYTDDNSTSNGEGGDDVIEGGAGADMMFGEGGDDTFIVSSGSDGDGDVVVGGNGPDDTTDNDTLDLRGAGDVTITQEADENDAGATKGTVTFENGETLSFEGVETILADNGAPIVGDDTASTDEDTPVTIDVLSNDVDPEGTDLTVVSATSPNGDVVINADGTITFTPSDNFNGDTTISYTVEDEDGEQSTGTVSVSVAPVNDDPVATDDTATTDYLTPVTVAVLGNDTDVDGDELTVTSATSPNGDVVINADGTITFTPAPGFDGDATIEYTVSDGQGGEDTATVTVTVADAPRDGIVDGTDGDDVIVDGYVDPDGDAIDANDAILPGETGNDDIVLAGDGDDSIASGDGNDEVFGGTGSDTISGGDDDDIIYGDDENGNLDTSGVDPVELNFSDVEPGSETAGTANTATAGDSVVYNNVATLEDGTQVSARLVLVSTSDPALQVDLASEEDYEVLLNANNDGTMNGETATFRLEFFDTNTGDPVELEPSVVFADLDQNVGQEILSITDPNLVNVGVPADSSLDVTYTPGGSLTAAGTEDNVDPNDPDSQIATVFGETSEIEFTLTSRGVNSGLNFGTTDGNDFEYIVPIAGDDTIDGDDGNDIIYGGGGNDVIADGAGNDSIFGGEGNDIIDDEPGTPNDSLGDDYVDGGEGDDTIYTGLGNDTLIGGEGDDLLSGEDGDDVIDGGEGNDLVYGGEGNDVIDTSNPTDPLPDLAYPGLWPADSDPSNDLDTVFGGAGNDTILTGDDADYIDAGEGDNYVDGGIDEDTIITGSGNDTVIGGEGDDTITTGAGDDLIYGGLDDSFPDAINIPDADGDLVTNNGQDTIDAGAGNDTVFGKDDDDVIYGGDGDDYLDGGVDEDEIYGGADSDTIIGGEAADQLFGGTGSDTFFGGTSGDVVVGGEDADNLDQDVLDLTGSNVDFITYTSPDNEDGVVTFDDGSTMTFSEIENVIPCFTPGTLIATARGERPVEDLQVGDRIITRDNGIQEIAWVGHKQFQGADLVRNPHLKPVLIKAGSLGNDLPERDMLVSPNHRLLVASDMTQLYFEESEVLAAAKHMVGSQGIHRVDVTQTTYIHFMFERHEVVLSDGAWTESFQPGDYSLKGIGNSQRNEIFELFPELREKQGLQDYQAARKSLKKHEAKLLVR